MLRASILLRVLVGPLALACGGAEEAGDDDGHHHHDGPDAGVDEPCPADVGIVCTVAGDGESALAGNGGPAREASLSLPMDVAVGPDGTLYVVDFNNYMIRAIDPVTGIISRFAGNGGVLLEGCGGIAVGDDARDLCLNHPTGAAGSILYIADTGNHRIRAVRLE